MKDTFGRKFNGGGLLTLPMSFNLVVSVGEKKLVQIYVLDKLVFSAHYKIDKGGGECSDHNTFDGEIIDHYLSGSIHSKKFIQDGVYHQLKTVWHENGELKREIMYNKGAVEYSREWSETGQLLFERTTNKIREWHNNGQLARENDIVNGAYHGECTGWYPSGQLEMMCTFNNDKKHRLYTIWYDNGQLAEQGEYINSRQHGLCNVWDENGNVKTTMWDMGVEVVQD